MKTQTRRKFICDGAKITGAAICTANLGLSSLFAQSQETENNQFPESHCGSIDKGSRKILIAYASDYGSTGEIAVAIGDTLCEAGNTVDTKWIKNLKDLSEYDAVLVGSPIIYEDWLPEAREFVQSNKDILKEKPVAYFISCMAMSRKEEGAIEQAIEYSDKLCTLVPEVKPVSIGRFGGVLDYSKIPFFTGLLTKSVMVIHKVKEGDYRDWNAIRSWAKSTDSLFN